MKTFTKTTGIFALLAVIVVNASAQYCTFTVDFANSFLAGITNVQLNSNPAINRTSTTTENNGFTSTGITVVVNKGSSYNFSVTANQDNMVCGQYNIKVYIDYNGDSDFVDAGEDAVTMNNVAAGAQAATFVVPATAATAQVRMRVALKMATACGHSAVSPCNIPADPIAWHGEVEDYTLDIQSVIGINELNALNGVSISPNPTSGKIQIISNQYSVIGIEIYNVIGKKAVEVLSDRVNGLNPTTQQLTPSITLNLSNLPDGIYFMKVISDKGTMVKKVIVTH